MKIVVVGLGNQGMKRLATATERVVASVDPVNPDATHRDLSELPLKSYEAAFVCTPEDQKFEIVEYLLANGKHVLVEKPLLVPRQSELVRLGKLALANAAVLYTAYNHRFEPNVCRLKTTLEAGDLGRIYRCRFFYGNGTASDVKSSDWRDQGLGVLADLGSHLLDLYLFFFGKTNIEMTPWSFNCFENQVFDHVIFGADANPILEFEATLLSWKNSFSIDVWGEHGSAHVDGLCKWGPSTFGLRERIFPSGKPNEEQIILECPDSTWEAELEYFDALCRDGHTNVDDDLWISKTLLTLAEAYHQAGLR